MKTSAALVRSHLAPAPRTLVEIFAETAQRFPDQPALDDGQVVLTYAELAAAIDVGARGLAASGVRRGDRVGVRIPSGTAELYTAILAVLAAGAAYVPVDVDDPDERARTVFAEAGVKLILTEGDLATVPGHSDAQYEPPVLTDDAWIIFTSGSTGTPKGVAVSHRSAAAFVDAEARIFLQDAPLAPGDRVLAGLSVAFDASCEEMWLAWGHGACLVPAPRALVRTGIDLGPWLVSQEITVISTVPTLAGLWDGAQLENIRMLIFGGEACPPELAARLATHGREVWNTYGPTEATVVACAAILDGNGPVRIGLPLDGWDLAVVGPDGRQVAAGDSGELIIGGVGLARYLDAEKDALSYAPAPELGWERAYRSGDLVRFEEEGLIFLGRADDQVKLGGRRIELGEVDAAMSSLPSVAAAACAVQRTAAGTSILVGYLAATAGDTIDLDEARRLLRAELPAALVPQLTVIDEIPTRTSGKIDRAALPWPLERIAANDDGAAGLTPSQAWVATKWTSLLGTAVSGPDEDFFASGGGSLVAAQLVSALRERYPTVTVADVYEEPRLGDLCRRLEEMVPAQATDRHVPSPLPLRAQFAQIALGVPLAIVVGLRWLTWLLIVVLLADVFDLAPWMPDVPGAVWWAIAGWIVFISPGGRMGSTIVVSRFLLRHIGPGRYDRGGSVHLRVWFSESWAAAAGVGGLACAPWTAVYARLLGAKVGKDVDLHALPPVTGLLTLGNGCSIEPEVDLSGHWLEGDIFVMGRVRVDKRATVGTRSTLAPGSRIGQGAEIAPGSAVTGSVPPGERWGGSPAAFLGRPKVKWPSKRAPRGRRWVAMYGVSAAVLAMLPLVAAGAGLLVVEAGVRDATSLAAAVWGALLWAPVGALASMAVLLVMTWAGVRLLSIGMTEGFHAVRSRTGWQIWATFRLMDDARQTLFPLYSSTATPAWLRSLGADIGRDVEASTVLMIPALTTVGEGAFLADDTLIGSYELGRGWLRVERASIGKKAFLGNSGMIAPGRAVPKRGLVAVLSATPRKAKAGTSWIGSPPQQLRRVAADSDGTRTYQPARRLRVGRALVELARIVPVMVSFALGVAALVVLLSVVANAGILVAGLASGFVVLAIASVACAIATAAKWLLVGRIRKGDHPLWSSFIWRNELADTFVEVVAVPWLGPAASGSPALNVWLRSLGARIGRGVWLETYWLPEADLVTVGDGATVNRGCVLQTHLFHDRVMSMDTVTIGRGASIGPHGVILPAASAGDGASIGPASLVLRGDAIPAGTRWAGNPVVAVGV
ncbi:Pls/PosA family non-ribosomal peptide synthetase [Demequina aurantiaca]|uniref:Pls/PosA family non-ribosomal peptide synthetase n=1 Tax=Demequina aurantiaca TaxID=676200 RepID=UPI003D3376AE